VLEAQREYVRHIERATEQIVLWVPVHADGSRWTYPVSVDGVGLMRDAVERFLS
jgi:hypothetical protein